MPAEEKSLRRESHPSVPLSDKNPGQGKQASTLAGSEDSAGVCVAGSAYSGSSGRIHGPVRVCETANLPAEQFVEVAAAAVSLLPKPGGFDASKGNVRTPVRRDLEAPIGEPAEAINIK